MSGALRVAVLKGGRSLERQRLAALRRPRRGRAGAARPRGRRRSTSTHDLVERLRDDRRPTSRSSPCTARAARTARSRSCSRRSASPTPGRRPAACAMLAWTRRWPSTCCATRASRRRTSSSFSETAFKELGAADALPDIEERARLPARRQARAPGLGARRPVRGARRASCRARSSPRSPTTTGSLLERHVDGRELAVSVLGGEALPVVEAVPREEDLYDFEARYEIGRTTFACPAELDADGDGARRSERRGATSASCSAAAACARVDLMLDERRRARGCSRSTRSPG